MAHNSGDMDCFGGGHCEERSDAAIHGPRHCEAAARNDAVWPPRRLQHNRGMLFNSTEFLFVFLPALLIVFFQLARVSRRLAAGWLALGSLFFYGWWNPAYVTLLLGSIGFNYTVGRALAQGADVGSKRRKHLLVLHQAWRGLRVRMGHNLAHSSRAGRAASIALTFLVVVVGWVFFRASSFDAAMVIVRGMAGLNGISLPDMVAARTGALAPWLAAHGVVFTPGGGRDFAMTYVWVAALLPIVFWAPNTQQIMQGFQPALDHANANNSANTSPTRLAWRSSPRWALAMSVVLALGLLSLTRPSEFLYFQF